MADRAELERFSARVGGDPALVQGAGGNTSIKGDGRLLVKASGFQLKHALDRDVFVEVAMTDALAMVGGGAAPVGANGLRASIETSLHALLPQTVVVHLHMVCAIAIAVRGDAEAEFAGRLAGLPWAMVPYVQPGVPLARAVQASLREAGGEVRILVLANHGIVFAGSTFEEIDALMADVAERLDAPARDVPEPDDAAIAAAAARYGLRPARNRHAHTAALDPAALDFATAGSLYPDHVVFLGRRADRLEGDAMPAADSLLHLVPGVGALLSPGVLDDADDMAACLAEVCRRIPEGAQLATLSRADEDVLANWDAEIYRQSLARAGR